MRVLGVDFGSKRIGLAVGDTEFGIASPRPALVAVQGLKNNAQAVTKIMEAEEAQAAIVGIPILTDQPESGSTKICRQFASALREQGFEVIEVDESLTSVEAEERLGVHDWTAAQRDRHKDAEAACLILERYFAQHGKT